MINRDISDNEILESIREGVKDAFLEMMDAHVTYREEQVMEAIKQGVESAFLHLFNR